MNSKPASKRRFLSAGSPAFARSICRLLADKLAEPVILLRVPEFSGLSDFVVVAVANSSTHIEALEKYLRQYLKTRIALARPTEGKKSKAWRIVDAGSVIVHIMDEPARRRYRIEDLWSDAPIISWNTRRISLKRSKKN